MRAPSADEELVRRAIRARGDSARIGAVVHALLAVICLCLIATGGQPLPLALGGAGLGAVGVSLEVMSRRKSRGSSAALHALLHEPGKVEQIAVVDHESGVQVRVTAGGATDYVCPPGDLDELIAALRRRSPQAAMADHR